MNTGKIFELDFKNSIPKDVYYFRIHDSVSAWNTGDSSENKARFTPKNDFDVLLFKSPRLYLLELKSTKGTSFSFEGKSANIKQHQIDGLTKASKYFEIIAGFLLNFSETHDTFFIHIKDFNALISIIGKKSINMKDIVKYGGIRVQNIKKITRYRYDIEGFIKNLQKFF